VSVSHFFDATGPHSLAITHGALHGGVAAWQAGHFDTCAQYSPVLQSASPLQGTTSLHW